MSIKAKGNGHEPHYDLPEPNPDLGPEEVVRIVLGALQHNDEPGPDSGVRTAYNFASPGNKVVTGPIAQFVEMVRKPTYNILIDFKESRIEPAAISGDHARLVVHILSPSGDTATFVFELSRQTQPPYRGCWMTDSVIPSL
jgi:hypothetical protein